MDHSALSQAPLSNSDDPISHDYPTTTEASGHQSKLCHSGQFAPHAEHQPSSLTHDHGDVIMDHPAPSISPHPDDDAEVYGLSNLCWSQQIADDVEKISQQ